jgi:hypothetical protein
MLTPVTSLAENKQKCEWVHTALGKRKNEAEHAINCKSHLHVHYKAATILQNFVQLSIMLQALFVLPFLIFVILKTSDKNY